MIKTFASEHGLPIAGGPPTAAQQGESIFTYMPDNIEVGKLAASLVDKTFSIDARPSDAIALALRTNSPIYVNDKVVEDSRAVNLGKEEKLLNEATNEEQKWREILENLSPDDFGKYKMWWAATRIPAFSFCNYLSSWGEKGSPKFLESYLSWLIYTRILFLAMEF